MAEEVKELEGLEEAVGNAADLLDDGSVAVDKFYAAEAGGIDCVIGKDLIIKALAERQSLFAEGSGKYFTITAEAQKKGKGKDKEVIGFNTGSTILVKELQQLEGHLPVHATIEKVKAGSGYSYYQIKR